MSGRDGPCWGEFTARRPVVSGCGTALRESCGGHGKWPTVEPFALERFVPAICANTTRPHRLRAKGWGDDGKWRWITRRYFELEEEQVRATARRNCQIDRLSAVQRRQ
ncbi:hypothetical protein [Streptomyces sp. IB2014 016-6]|uniref:hypothetical protein n=1 Tax=Streptomyces sp. IB2014 016-6 TaxID=2517818 RepID=UPI0011C9B218|nr:hypothetical protein [Streptomyces sp. IB2014 016-6]TXL87695.1 hypothetical protein EW053_22525 [Streptomyces sp. IB2014 016-6]